MSHNDAFEKLYDQASKRKVNLQDLKNGVETFPGTIEDVEQLYPQLSEEREHEKPQYRGWIIVLCAALCIVVPITTILMFGHLPRFGLVAATETPIQTPVPTLTPAPFLTVTPTAQTLTATATIPPTSTYLVADLAGVTPPVPICGVNPRCAVWKLNAVTSPELQTGQPPSLKASAVDGVTASWNMGSDAGFHVNGLVAVYMMDYSAYNDPKAPSKGLLSYSVELDPTSVVSSQITLTDDERFVQWVPLGVYRVETTQKISIQTSMQADSSYLPVGPMLVVRFPDPDQIRLNNLLTLVGNNPVLAVLDEDSRTKQDNKWASIPGDGIGEDIIQLDANHMELSWSLPAKLSAGKYQVYVYIPKDAPLTKIKCEGQELSTGTEQQQWYPSIEITVPEKTAKKLDFACTWKDDGTGGPVFLDAIAIVGSPNAVK